MGIWGSYYRIPEAIFYLLLGTIVGACAFFGSVSGLGSSLPVEFLVFAWEVFELVTYAGTGERGNRPPRVEVE